MSEQITVAPPEAMAGAESNVAMARPHGQLLT